MKVIMIDDEQLALNYLEYQLSQIADVQIIGKYTDPFEGKQNILAGEPDVVFLDIHLPEMNGIELAEQLLESKPRLNIVFVTAYDDYAIQAFELNALDYVLKPVGAERLQKTIQRIMDRAELTARDNSAEERPLRMKLFRQLLIESEERQWIPLRWRTSRVQELFLYLLQHRGQLVRKSALIELLWPEFEPGRAYSQLYTAVYHIRKTLEPFGDHFKIANSTDAYMLNIENVELDIEEWEQFIHSGLPLTAKTMADYEKAMELYSGDYLQEYEYWWAESERHRLKLLWLRTASDMASWYVTNHRQDQAVARYLDICQRYPQAEEAHFSLMQLYAASNKHLLVHRQYRLLLAVLQDEFNEQPSQYITEWYNHWSQQNKE